MTKIKMEILTNDERCVISMLNGPMGPTKLVVGGTNVESVLSHRAALAMLSLIARDLVRADLFNDTGRVEYSATALSEPLRGKVTQKFLEQHGKWPITIPNPFPRVLT